MFKDVETFKKEFISNVENKYAVEFENSTPYQQYVVLGEMLRYYIAKDWLKTNEATAKAKARRVYYFSMEFLMGRMITNNLMNAGVYPVVKKASGNRCRLRKWWLRKTCCLFYGFSCIFRFTCSW